MFRSRTTHSALTRDPKHIHLQYAWYRIRSAFVRRIKLMYSRLEDRIRILCDKVLANPNSPEMLGILNELRAAPTNTQTAYGNDYNSRSLQTVGAPKS
jgi:hypothetical protein